jgi:RNA polymerase sigma factor (sigma-70 family)
MATVLGHRVGRRRIVELDDERLATLVRSGDEAAFEILYDRHHASLLAFCRHMLGSREDGEDALQQTFVRAHRALREGRPPDTVRPWLFAIARNRCRTMLAARRDAAVPVDEHEVGFDGLAEDVRRRAELRELVADLGRLPDDQREALVLFELGDLSHAEIATTIGCPPGKVKALVFQARTALIAERDARGTPCEEIRDQLEVARGGVLRRGSLRRHLRQCEPCRAYGGAVTTQRANLAWVLPVVPTAGLKAGVLTAAGGTGAATAAVVEAVSLGAAATGAGAMATTGGIAVKGLVAKAAITIAFGAGVTGAVTTVDGGSAREPATTRAAQTSSSVERRPASPGTEQRSGGALGARVVSGAVGRPARAAAIQRRRSIRRTRRLAARLARRAHLAPRRAARRAVRRLRRLQNATRRVLSNTTLERRATSVQLVRRRAAHDERRAARDPDHPRRRRHAAPPTTTTPVATAAPTSEPDASGDRRRRRRQGPPPTPPTTTPPAATDAPTSEPDATADRPRRRRRGSPPTPPAPAEPAPAAPEPTPEATDVPAP